MMDCFFMAKMAWSSCIHFVCRLLDKHHPARTDAKHGQSMSQDKWLMHTVRPSQQSRQNWMKNVVS